MGAACPGRGHFAHPVSYKMTWKGRKVCDLIIPDDTLQDCPSQVLIPWTPVINQHTPVRWPARRPWRRCHRSLWLGLRQRLTPKMTPKMAPSQPPRLLGHSRSQGCQECEGQDTASTDFGAVVFSTSHVSQSRKWTSTLNAGFGHHQGSLPTLLCSA